MKTMNSFLASEMDLAHMGTSQTQERRRPMETTMVMPAPVTAMMPNAAHNMGRDKVHWSQEVWDRIDKAVHDEVMRTRVGQRFLPLRPVIPRTTSVPFDSITLPTEAAPSLSVDEGATTRLNEYWVEFSLTPAQVEHETGNIMELGHSTAVT